MTTPAGYGKTSLLVDFAHVAGLPVCWYRLDAADADPAAFVDHVAAPPRERYGEVGGRTPA